MSLPEGTPPIAVEALSGDGQSAVPGEELPQPIVVKVTDADGRPLPDVSVSFTLGPDADGGEITPDTALTNEDGEASAQWVLGAGLGEQQVHAEVVGAGLNRVNFTATAVEDVPQPSAEQSSVTALPERLNAPKRPGACVAVTVASLPLRLWNSMRRVMSMSPTPSP